ncbi:GNAT family N-acetyltransferase [Sphingomonas sp. LC-1]|uniref:GNAT family N-acetyltransferase n=1 Tax=Sphingomonas sp. LC-1 TaxID=3110957 RepID=UPI00386610BC
MIQTVIVHGPLRRGQLRSVHHAATSDYSPEQVAVWSPFKPDAGRYVQQAVGRIFLVAEGADGRIAGYGDLEPNGHIDHLYCRSDVVRTGVGSAIYAALESAAIDAGIATLFVEASEGARRLLERRGFTVDGRNDLTINGVAIHNYRMSKSLTR